MHTYKQDVYIYMWIRRDVLTTVATEDTRLWNLPSPTQDWLASLLAPGIPSPLVGYGWWGQNQT